jgi:hypothetical protein
MNQNSSVGGTTVVRFLAGFYFFTTTFRPAPYSMGTAESSYPGGKAVGAWSWLHILYNVEV